MSKVTLLPEVRKVETLREYLIGRMKVKGITQDHMAKELNITRKTLHDRMCNGTLTVIDLIQIFEMLETPSEKRVELLTL